MNIWISLYRPESGRINHPVLVMGWEEADLQLEVNPGMLWVMGKHDGETHYVKNSIVIPRPECPAYDHTMWNGAPDGSIVTLMNESDETKVVTYPLPEGEQVTLIHSGTYRYHVDPVFPYLKPEPGEITIV